MTDARKTPKVVSIQLLSLGRINLLPGELLAVLRHRHLLAVYLLVLFLLVGLDTNGAGRSLPIESRGAIYVASMVAFMLGVLACILGRARFGGTKARVTMHMSPVLLLATLGSVNIGEGLLRTLMDTDTDGLTRIVLLFTFHYMVAELAVALAAHKLLPSIIGEIRNLPIRTLAETDPALWTDADNTAQPPDPAPQGFLVAAGRSYPLQTLLHLRADGNYVHLRATDRTELLPGPLADLVEQLPESMGRQVHRSHWVAARAVRDWQAEGREITLHLTDGETVAAAVTRRREVRDWLLALGLPKRGTP